MKILLLLLSLLSINIAFAQTTAKIPYTIESKKFDATFSKATIDVRLSRKLTKDEIKIVATEIMNKYSGYTKYFIFYWLPNVEIGTGAWATSHFNNNSLFVNIQGVDEATEKKLKNAKIPEGTLIGKWYDGRAMVENTIIIYKKGNVTRAREVYKGGGFNEKDLTKSGSKYIYENDFGEFYKIESDGNLGLYSQNGRYGVASKIE